MRNLITIGLLHLYLLSLIGLNVNIHHCGEKISYEVFGVTFNDSCNCKHRTSKYKSSCCKNHNLQIKAPITAGINNHRVYVKAADASIISAFIIPNTITETLTTTKIAFEYAYPPGIKRPIYLLNQHFLI